MDVMFFNNPASQWAIAFMVAVLVTLGLSALKAVAVRRLARLAARTETRIDDVLVAALDATSWLLLAVLGLYAGATLLRLTPGVDLFLKRAAITAALAQAAIWFDSGLRGWLNHYRASAADDPGRATSAAAIGFIARIALWSVIALMMLDNLGFNITTLVASLGIGGIAVALAVQNVLGDLFASLSIVLDKPFVIGDFIVVNDVAGSVEYVGLKTTRVRALSGEQIIFSNADLLKSRIHNYKRMETRRVVFSFGVEFGTSSDDLRAIPRIVEAIVKAQPKARFDRAHFSGVGSTSLNFEVVYIVQDADYGVHMDIQQEVQLQLYDALNGRGIAFAFPTQTVHVVEANGQADAELPHAGAAMAGEAAGAASAAPSAGQL